MITVLSKQLAEDLVTLLKAGIFLVGDTTKGSAKTRGWKPKVYRAAIKLVPNLATGNAYKAWARQNGLTLSRMIKYYAEQLGIRIPPDFRVVSELYSHKKDEAEKPTLLGITSGHPAYLPEDTNQDEDALEEIQVAMDIDYVELEGAESAAQLQQTYLYLITGETHEEPIIAFTIARAIEKFGLLYPNERVTDTSTLRADVWL